MNIVKPIRVFVTMALLAAPVSPVVAAKQWIGGGSTLNWSVGLNWSDSLAPTAGDVLYFEDLLYDTGYTNAAKAVNNVVGANTTVGSANYLASSFSLTNHFYTTLIPETVTLTLGGLGANPPAALAVGDIPGELAWASSGSFTNYSTITGPGTLVVDDSATQISVARRNRATLDLTELNTFTANVNQVLVGASVDNPNTTGPTGWLLLGKTNTITTAANLNAPGVLLGQATNSTGTGVLGLGGVNSLNTDGLIVGGRRGGSTFLFFGPTFSNAVPVSTLKLRGSAGASTPVPTFAIGDASGNADGYNTPFPGTAASAAGTADFSGATVDILADSIFIGRATEAQQVATGTGSGTLIVEQGTVSATNVYIAYKSPGSTNASIGRGLLTLRSNAVMNVYGNVALVYRTNGTAFIDDSRLTVNDNAVLNIGGDLITTHTIGSWTPASVNLGGGTINMTGGGSVSIPGLLGGGSLTNASSITVTNVLSAGAVNTADTLVLGNNLTLGSAVKLVFNLGANTTVGGGVNDYISVANNVTFNNNPITLTYDAPLVVGTYSLIAYGGAQSGLVTWVNPTRSLIGLDQGNGQVAIVVTNYTPGALTWKSSGGTANWESTTTNWNNNTEKFFALDEVLFDDTGVATNVVIASLTNFPSGVTFNNSVNKYTVTQSGSGAIGGFGGLTKNGTGTLVMGGGGLNNYFTGPINLNQGTIQIASFNSGVFGVAGSTNAINIAPGATLDCLNGFGSPGTYGRYINVGGTGVGGVGAIMSGASSSPSVSTLGVNLTADTLVAETSTGNLVLAGVFPPYSSLLNLNGYTLTTSGSGSVRLNQLTVTNAGSIVVNGANLGLNSVILDGPGTLNLGNKYLNFYSTFTTGYVAKAISVNNGGILASAVNAATIPLLSPISIAIGGSVSITNGQRILASGVISGPGGSLAKYGNSNLVLTAANTYSGSTLVAGGTLSLSGAGALASPTITVNSGAALDVSSLPAGYAVAAGQTIQVDGASLGNFNVAVGGVLRGTGTNNGQVTVSPGGTLAVGSTTTGGTLTMAANLTFNGGTNTFKLGGPEDLVVVGGDLTFTAPVVININPVGSLTGTHILYQYAGALTGATTNNLKFSSPRPLNFVLDTNTPGVVAVTISGSVTLDWAGGAPGAPTAWDVNTTTNWLNGANPDIFFPGDAVQFGDSPVTNVVQLAAPMQPAAISLNSSATPYTFTGVGGITAGSLAMNGGASLTLSNSGNVTLTGSGLALNLGTLTFAQPTNSTLTAQMAGDAGLAKTGTNTLTIVSANSTNFHGTIAVDGGTLRPGSVNALGTSTITVAGGATLDVNGQIGNLAIVSVSGAGVDGSGAINNRGLRQTNALANVALNGNTTLGAISNRWDVAPFDNSPTPGIFSGNNYKLTKTGTNDLWLRQLSDTGLGDIDITAGRLVFAGSGTLLGNNNSNIVVRTNAALGFGGGVQDIGKNTLIAPGGQLYALGSGNQFGGNIVLSNGLVQMESLGQLTLGGNLSGPAILNLMGVNAGNFGTLTLSGTNTYTGGTLVNDGQLNIASSDSIPGNTNIVLSSRVLYNTSGHPILGLLTNVVSPASARLDMQTVGSAGAAQASLTGDGGTWSGPIKITGSLPQCVANFSSGLGGLTVAGAVDGTGFFGNSGAGNGGVKISGDNVLVSDVTLGGIGVRFNNSLQFTGTLSCVNSGLGGAPGMTKLVLASGGNYWTNMFWQRGILQIGADNALPLCSIRIGTLAASADHRVVLDLNGHGQTLVDWTETFTGNDPSWFGNSSTNANAVLTYAGTVTNTWTVYIVDAFDLSAPVQKQTALSVTAGYLKLVPYPLGEPTPGSIGYFPSGPPPYPFGMTYTGPTTISGGTLEVDKYLGVSPVVVSGAGVLRGNGSLGGPVTIASGGTLAPGSNTLGALTVTNNLTLSAGSKSLFRISLSAGTNDSVVGIDHLVYGGTLTITNIGAQAITNGTILPLFSAASYTAGNVTVLPNVPAYGLRWDTSYLAVDGTLRVAPVNTNPTSITATVAGGSYDLSWPADHLGWRLQSQTNSLSVGLTTNWLDVASSTQTNQVSVPISPANPAVFFRLTYP